MGRETSTWGSLCESSRPALLHLACPLALKAKVLNSRCRLGALTHLCGASGADHRRLGLPGAAELGDVRPPGQGERPRRRRSLTLRSHCPVGDARLNKVLGCFGPRVETDLPEHFAVLLGVHVVVPKGAISVKKVGCDGLDRCGQFVEQCSRL